MAHLTPDSDGALSFTSHFTLDVGDDTVELHNPTTDEIQPMREELVQVVLKHAKPPYTDLLRNEAITEAMDGGLLQRISDVCWSNWPDAERARKACELRMTPEQIQDMTAKYIQVLGLDAVVELARRGPDTPLEDI